jgi:cell wall-associated NlpC family hydrolase
LRVVHLEIMKQLLLLCGWLCLFPLPALATTAQGASSREGPLAYALRALGARYRYGGSSPDTGFDCSGLIAHAFEQAWGLPLPHNARAQSRLGKPVKRPNLAPGDLVFYNTRDQPYSHVGMYIGNGRFIHAPKPGARVRIERFDTPYWQVRFNGARRLDIDNYSH